MNPYRVTLSLIWIGLFCVFWTSQAFAQLHDWNGTRTSPGSIYKRGPNGLPFNVDTGRYVGIDSAANGGATLKGRYVGSLAGRSLAIESAQIVSGSALASAAKGLARFAGPAALAMTLAPLVWDEVQDIFMTPDPNMSPNSYPSVNYWATDSQFNNSMQYPDAVSSCRAAHGMPYSDVINLGSTSGTCVGRWSAAENWQSMGTTQYRRTCPNGGVRSGNVCTSMPPCPEGQAYNVQGICADSRGTPTTDQELEDAIYVELVARGMGSDLARRLIASGYEPQVIDAAGPVQLSGPSSVQGGTTSSTTTGPAGTTITNITTNYDITYQGDTVTVTETTTTTTTRPDGSTETSTETKTPAPGTEAPSQPSEAEQTPFCELYPDASACQPLGDAGSQDLGTETRTVQLDYDGAAGSCPAPHMMNLQGKSVSFSYGPLCDFAQGIRPLVIALSMLFAGLFLLSVARSQ